MSFATRHNKGSIFTVDTEGFDYKKLEDLYNEDADKIHVIQGIYINHKSEYGDAPVAICESYFANLPGYLLDECQGMLASEEDIRDIKAGLVGFVVDPYEKKVGKNMKTCYGIKWVDVDE